MASQVYPVIFLLLLLSFANASSAKILGQLLQLIERRGKYLDLFKNIHCLLEHLPGVRGQDLYDSCVELLDANSTLCKCLKHENNATGKKNSGTCSCLLSDRDKGNDYCLRLLDRDDDKAYAPSGGGGGVMAGFSYVLVSLLVAAFDVVILLKIGV